MSESVIAGSSGEASVEPFFGGSPRSTPSPTFELLGVSLVVALFALAYYPAMMNLVASWSSSEMYSYGFLVPVISAGLIWMRRGVLRGIPVAPSLAWGAMIAGAALLIRFAGRISMIAVLEQFALVLTICGLTLLLLGRRMSAALAFPIGYLLSMIPFWDVFTAGVHPHFQDYSATIGVSVLRLFGIPVIREGFFLELPNITLEVAEECSGVNNLIAVLCVGLPVTYLSVRRWWKRAVIMMAAVVIALLSNGARVATVSLFAYYGIRGADGDVHGPFSLLRTMFVSGVGFAVLFWLVSRLGDRDAPLYEPSHTWQQGRGRDHPGLGLHPVALVVAVLMLSSAIGLSAWHRVTTVPLSADLVAFPESVGGWWSTGRTVSNDLDELNFDERRSRIYVAPDGTELKLFIGYYRQQAPGKELADHRMRAALIGPTASVYPTAIGDGARAKDFLTNDRGQTYHVTYWYVLNGRVVHEDYQAKLHTAWNSLAHRKSNGAVVVVRVRTRAEETVESARARVRDFIEGLMSASNHDLPHP